MSSYVHNRSRQPSCVPCSCRNRAGYPAAAGLWRMLQDGAGSIRDSPAASCTCRQLPETRPDSGSCGNVRMLGEEFAFLLMSILAASTSASAYRPPPPPSEREDPHIRQRRSQSDCSDAQGRRRNGERRPFPHLRTPALEHVKYICTKGRRSRAAYVLSVAGQWKPARWGVFIGRCVLPIAGEACTYYVVSSEFYVLDSGLEPGQAGVRTHTTYKRRNAARLP